MSEDDVWRAYLKKYGRVYDPKANAKASDDKARLSARIKAQNQQDKERER